ncbi:hypothetical protein [Staphylococcus massiliensis]|uniref:Gas vesicle protein-protein n=1 Tax=Staphylococcus massiliensis S46 TaxID=1229783 RepID=K9AH16_9STAP|nr:hypothetical protein [Staphylococcus massiliensis]EKU46574.1 hypothetical protein C273_08986 [Staphylococcus massiliensis S46]MCG3399661.1 YtxH domain-containing protein [Staphylococcus massiliensis]MCG3400765.1 YtxH domain-containing protein [Staphylococcus massiliensis]MCG3412070.1 YtxH domain-containing protein [Staphylococcus massiliensis]PNZ99063.1 hypothetical protein CD133_07240 [Staphylococcus massiliensis CCUG 55927]
MKAVRILLGLGAGLATGLGVSLMKRDYLPYTNAANAPTTSNQQPSETEKEFDFIKANVNNIVDNVNKIQTEGKTLGSTLGEEVKTMIEAFKSDIDPNINNLKTHVEDLKSRGEVIQEEVSDITNKKKK